MKNSMMSRLEKISKIILKNDSAVSFTTEMVVSGIEKYNVDTGDNLTIEEFRKLVITARVKGVSSLSDEELRKLSEIFKKILKLSDKIIGSNFHEQ